MSEDVQTGEQPPVHRPHQQRKSGKRLFVLIALLITVAAIAATWWLQRPTNPLREIKNKVGFSIYYPHKIPGEYRMDENSVKFENGILFFSLRNENKVITVTQQPKPNHDLGLDTLVGFNTTESPAGKAVSGTQSNRSSALITTDSTLIIITGSNDVALDVINDVTKNLRKL